MNSSEENILESLPEIENAIEEMEENQIEKNDEQELSPEASPDPSIDKFLVQSFQQLQKEVTEKMGEKDLDNSPKESYAPTYSFTTLRRGSEPSPARLSPLVEDESDYIDIDCDVQPMPALNRPLVYGYGNRLPLRTRNMSQQYRHSFHQTNIHPSSDFHPKTSFSPGIKDPSMFSNMKETLWDYYLAKSKSQEIDRIETLPSTKNLSENQCNAANDYYYDPEILLAQISHPRSLKNATFSEYSTHIKSSIMERYALQHENKGFHSSEEMGYGSCFDLAEKNQSVSVNDPGYYSESDVTKMKLNEHDARKSEYNDEYENYYPAYPSLREQYIRHEPIQHLPPIDPVDYFQQLKTDSNYENVYKSRHNSEIKEKRPFPRSNHGHFENPLSRPLGQDPWLHLLPDVTPPRTPLRGRC